MSNAAYFRRDGERVFVIISQFKDPDDREAARRIYNGLYNGPPGSVQLSDVFILLERLRKQK